MSAEPLLLARDLACLRGGRRVLEDVGVGVAAGEVVGVLGANGAGKSTLLAALAGELPAQAGQVVFDGRAIGDWPPPALARRRAVLPQTSALAFDLPVRTVVGIGAYPHGGLPTADDRARAMALADVAHLADRRYRTLSGGEQQRVQFARVLLQLLADRPAGEPRALLLDEPTANLDPRHQLRLLATVAEVAHREGVAALVVLHDVNLAAVWCDRLLLLAQGRVAALGVPAAVLTEPVLEHVYDVQARVIARPGAADRPLVLFDAA